MKQKDTIKINTVAEYNNSVLKSDKILTGKEFRRMKRKSTTKN